MALYNNGYPVGYPQMYPQYIPQNNMAQSPNNVAPSSQGSIIWVQGEAGAKSYLVAPNNTVQLWDSENQTIYLKSADASGMPSMKVLDYTIRESPQNGSNSSFGGVNDKLSVYATKDDFKSVSDQLEELRLKVDSMNRRRGKSEVDE